ncbi:MAG: type IX secretion system protein PorQ [Crocinitomicaceae bacterium]|nr:type IX secretion system protein PorQ [Crocinitomicaceae bacterium]
MKNFSLFLMVLFGLNSFGQEGGQHVFQFLDLDLNARSSALGGDFIALRDDDVSLALSNPAMIQESMNNNFSMNHFFMPAGINYGSLIYARNFEEVGTFTGHLQYVNYGRFTRTDVNGAEQGYFTAGEYSLGVGYGKNLNKYFSIGGNFKTIFSHYETYTSVGVAGDLAIQFYAEEQNFTATLLTRNVGYQLKGFTKGNREPLPLEVLLGVSYKFHHAPFRLSIVATDLTEWDLTYSDPNALPTIDQLTGDTIPPASAGFATKLFYHTNFGLEILPSENFHLRFGFNFHNRDALGVEGRKIFSGISMGFGVNVKKFRFDYGLNFRASAGVSNVIGITTNFDAWRR